MGIPPFATSKGAKDGAPVCIERDRKPERWGTRPAGFCSCWIYPHADLTDDDDEPPPLNRLIRARATCFTDSSANCRSL